MWVAEEQKEKQGIVEESSKPLVPFSNRLTDFPAQQLECVYVSRGAEQLTKVGGFEIRLLSEHPKLSYLRNI